jgi:hypothetical protein
MIDFDATPSSGAYARARWEQYMRDEQLDHEPVLDLAAAFQLFNTSRSQIHHHCRGSRQSRRSHHPLSR